GAIFGLAQGIALASLASVAGATAAFFIGRTIARGWVSHRVESLPRFRALDRALAQKGFLIVMLTRLSPLFPFNLLNYAYGLTAVRVRDYVVASWLGMLPGTALYVYLGAAAADLAQVAAGNFDSGSGGRVLLVIGLLATVAVAILVARTASRALDREIRET
ncbi:MAG: TVP38/TMEM64 family protein, partial [Gemmatimonadetes bacterium]|nr:TVP38/TMEM64 family protein [Gemmatimonadota bacterium]